MSSIPSWFEPRLRERLEKPSEFEDGFFQYSGQSFADARPRGLFFFRCVLRARAGRLELMPQVPDLLVRVGSELGLGFSERFLEPGDLAHEFPGRDLFGPKRGLFAAGQA